MKIYNPHAVALTASAQRKRPAISILHDSPDARLVLFRIEPGQRVPPHTSDSTVILSVLAGSGSVTGGDEERAVAPGEIVAYEPGEVHGMEAGEETLIILATISPRPSRTPPKVESITADKEAGA